MYTDFTPDMEKELLTVLSDKNNTLHNITKKNYHAFELVSPEGKRIFLVSHDIINGVSVYKFTPKIQGLEMTETMRSEIWSLARQEAIARTLNHKQLRNIQKKKLDEQEKLQIWQNYLSQFKANEAKTIVK
jgi:hypothetical protein